MREREERESVCKRDLPIACKYFDMFTSVASWLLLKVYACVLLPVLNSLFRRLSDGSVILYKIRVCTYIGPG